MIILQRIVSLKFYLIYVDMYALFMKDKGGNPLKPYKLKRSIITARSMTSYDIPLPLGQSFDWKNCISF